MVRYDYQIAAGNNNAAGLVNIENITPTGGTPFKPPQGVGNWNPGAFRIRGDGTVYIAGYASTEWVFTTLTRLQHRYLMETYCNNSYSGKVTIRTKADDEDTYANYNAVMILSPLADAERNFTVYNNYAVQFVRVEAL